MKFWYYLILLNFFDILAVVFARYCVEKKKNYYMWLSMFFFGLTAFMFVKLLAFSVTAVINILWVAFSTVLIMIICYFLFDEKISLRQAMGMLIVLIGIYVMGL